MKMNSCIINTENIHRYIDKTIEKFFKNRFTVVEFTELFLI